MAKGVLLYGLWGEESFVVLGADWARRADDELSRLRAVATWKEAFEVARSMEVVEPPFNPDEFDLSEWGSNLSDPVDATELPGVGDGDFPPVPPRYTANWLPNDLLDSDELDVEWVETVFNGGYIRIGPDQADRLVKALQARGYRTTRDDSLVGRIAWLD